MNLRLRALLGAFSIFAAGLASGVAIGKLHSPQPVLGDSAADHHQLLMSELDRAIDLDEQQLEQLNKVLGRHQDFVQKAWEQLRPEVEIAMEKVHREIAELLRTDQRERYHEWLLERHHDGDGETFETEHHGEDKSHHP